ncbi:deleted in autism protein 1-like isoform X2 [Agrilus planipennis]|nr:deleted in autism protein 1-like isoform X2 [Agrilus planipennis]
MLTELADLDWSQRTYLALQILESALIFTEGDENFRYYLTDVSPDNIAVDSALKITFIDLENVIMVPKLPNKSLTVHRSDHWDEDSDFSFSEKQLCENSVSDHNIYAVCKLILSANAPYPMMAGGLLHHPPTDQSSKHNSILANIELCANPNQNVDRFLISRKIISDLEALHKSIQLD